MTTNLSRSGENPRRSASALLALAFSLSGLSASSEGVSAKLRYVRKIEGAEGKSGVAAIRLDKTVYERIGSFREIRVLDAKGVEIPYRTRLLRKSAVKTVETTAPADVISLKRLSGNKIELIVRNPKRKGRPVSLTIRTPNRNYDKRVAVSFSESKDGPWISCGDERSIFDYSAMVALSNQVVKLSRARAGGFYKLRISNFSEAKRSKRMELISERRGGREFSEIKKVMRFEETFKIDAVNFYFERKVKVGDAPIQEPAESAIIANAVKKKNTVVVLESYRQPIVRMSLESPSVNFTRGWELFASDDRDDWSRVASGKITKIRIGDCRKTAMSLHFPETWTRFLKLVVHNLDAPPIKISGVECFRNAYVAEFILPSEGGGDLKLHYGEDVPAPRYDIDAVLANASTTPPLFLKLGPENPNPDYREETKSESFWNGKPLMYALIAAVCAFLAFLLFSGFKKIPDSEDDASP